ncbi:MAG: MerR family transcriptional regulator, partial [Thermoleophilia bacterium]
MDGPERSWKVGELARATGLTIRALHHYDEIGLLVPARTQSGHRVYGPDDVERLYRVLALRGVGMALQDIAAALDDDGASLVDIVRRHVAAVERDIERRRRLLDRLREMLAALERSPAPPVDELLGAVEAMTVVEATIEDIVTREPWDQGFEMTAPCVVLLREAGGDRLLPIWIGEPEAAALVM